MPAVKVLYISSHPAISEAVRFYILNKFDRQIEVSIVTVDQFLRLDFKALLADPPDLVLFPVGFPGDPDLELVRRQRAAGLKAPLIVLCSSYYLPCYDELVKSGVQGVISSSVSLSEFETFIYAVIDGQPDALQQQHRRATAVISIAARTYGLTEREIAVLRLIAAGQSDKEIAAGLNISPKTVKTHLDHINSKLRTHNRTQAVVKAIALGSFQHSILKIRREEANVVKL